MMAGFRLTPSALGYSPILPNIEWSSSPNIYSVASSYSQSIYISADIFIVVLSYKQQPSIQNAVLFPPTTKIPLCCLPQRVTNHEGIII